MEQKMHMSERDIYLRYSSIQDLSHMVFTTIGRRLIILIISFCLTSILYAGSAHGSNKMNQKVLLDIDSNGKKIELKLGAEIQIELKAVGSAGYGWYFDKLDQDFFELVKEERKVIAPEKGDVTGTPVLMVWKLRTKKTGSSFIKVMYYRLWEGKEKAVNRFEVLVDIAP